MRKDAKYNRLTWQRKKNNGNRNHPKYTKDVRRKMYEEGYWDENDLLEYATNTREVVHEIVNRQKEVIAITEAIRFFKCGKFSERKPYIKALYEDSGASYNGYVFHREDYCYTVWKPTDENAHPEFKGESLVKVIPFNIPIKNIPDVLNAQPWTYI